MWPFTCRTLVPTRAAATASRRILPQRDRRLATRFFRYSIWRRITRSPRHLVLNMYVHWLKRQHLPRQLLLLSHQREMLASYPTILRRQPHLTALSKCARRQPEIKPDPAKTDSGNAALVIPSEASLLAVRTQSLFPVTLPAPAAGMQSGVAHLPRPETSGTTTITVSTPIAASISTSGTTVATALPKPEIRHLFADGDEPPTWQPARPRRLRSRFARLQF